MLIMMVTMNMIDGDDCDGSYNDTDKDDCNKCD